MSEKNPSTALLIQKALSQAKEEPKTRGMSLVITKLQEAGHWLKEHQEELRVAAARAGHGPPTT